MIKLISLLLFFCFGVSASEMTGRELAKNIRDLVPTENHQVSGILKIRKGKTRNEVPLTVQTLVQSNGWKVAYRTPEECLVIYKEERKPNRYFSGCQKEKILPVEALSKSFAGSDFSPENLGLEFLFWEGQQRIKGEMRLGRPCHVLESIDPKSKRKVISWIDTETMGILIAESYDPQNRLVKEFSLSGSSFKKVNGRWQLEEMKIRNLRTDSQTQIKFDLPRE